MDARFEGPSGRTHGFFSLPHSSENITEDELDVLSLGWMTGCSMPLQWTVQGVFSPARYPDSEDAGMNKRILMSNTDQENARIIMQTHKMEPNKVKHAIQTKRKKRG